MHVCGEPKFRDQRSYSSPLLPHGVDCTMMSAAHHTRCDCAIDILIVHDVTGVKEETRFI